MEYFLGSSAESYDVEGVAIDDCSVSLSENKPVLYGPCPFSLSSTVIRNGSRDIAPPAVERTPRELEQLAFALSVTTVGSIVPPVFTRDGDSAEIAQMFVKRCLAHGARPGRKRVIQLYLKL